MLGDLIRALKEFFTSEELQHMLGHTLAHFIKDRIPDMWNWARDHWTDVMDAVSNLF
jgi:hypothetical protein